MSPPRPQANEYNPYFDGYIQQVPDGPILDRLADQIEVTVALLNGVTDARALQRYAPGKWSLKELLGHMIDTERVFLFRGLWVARGETEEQPGFEQDPWVTHARFDRIGLGDLIDDFRVVRQSSLSFYRSLDDDAWERIGRVSGFPFSTRAAAWITAGHELHHRRIIQERYLTED